MKAVIDTMFWLSYSTLKESRRRQLIDRARRQDVRLYVSDWILDELTRILTEDLGRSARYADFARRAVLRIARQVALLSALRPYVPGKPNRDPVVHTALAARTDYLVTTDAALLAVKRVQDVEILTAMQFEARLEAEED